MVELNESHATFGKAACLEAIRGKGTWSGDVRPVFIQHRLRFSGNICRFRHAGLHRIRHLILIDATLNLAVAVLLQADADAVPSVDPATFDGFRC